MRLSVEKDDPGYAAFDALQDKAAAVVTLDDVKVKNCITADDKLGYVKRYAVTKDGQHVVCGESLLYEELQGTVTITIV